MAITTGFAVIPSSALVSATAAQLMAEACALQWAQDAAPAWNLPPMTFRVCSALDVAPGEISCLLTDLTPIEDDLGFHNPLGIQIEVSNILGSGPHDDATVLLNVCPVLSHEVLETGVDPNINLQIDVDDSHFDALEVCDPVQDNHYPITLGDGSVAWVSDFVMPRWFDQNTTRPATFDKMGGCTAPFQIVRGYMVQYDASGNATELFGSRAPNEKIRLMSRRRRRRLAWRPNEP